jgi:hypothetical protein
MVSEVSAALAELSECECGESFLNGCVTGL